MPVRVIFRRDARAEGREATRRYEQARAGPGDRFTAALQEAVERVVQMPDRFAPVYKDVRRALVSHFPYAVFFRVTTRGIRVIAVFHTGRDPAGWQQRADKEPS